MTTFAFSDGQRLRAARATDPKMWDELTISFQNATYEINHPEGDGPMEDDQNHTLYAYFDRDGRPLYVGITDNPGQRMAAHRKSAVWRRRATAYFWCDWNCCRKCLRDMEAMAIQILDPIHNIAGKP